MDEIIEQNEINVEGTEGAEVTEGTEAEKPKVEISEEELAELLNVDPDSLAAEFIEERKAMILDGVDVKALDEKLGRGEEYSDEELETIHKYCKVPVNQLKAHFKLVAKNVELGQKADLQSQSEQAAFIAEINEVAGGPYEELLAFIAEARDTEKVPTSKVTLWNLALTSDDPDLYKAAIQEMAETRTSLQPKAKTPANLGLLAQANNPSPKAPSNSPNNGASLAGNPYANATINQLCEVKANPHHPDYSKVLAVMKVRCPELA